MKPANGLPRNRVAVVGAGYAGMAAAVTLAERGVPVTVFESGPVPGGRARRVAMHGHAVDNGQHILIGAYRELLRLMRVVGADPQEKLLRLPLELRYASGFRLRAARLPAPLHLLVGLILARGLPFGERVGAIRFMQAMKRRGFLLAGDTSVTHLLAEHRQRGAVARYLWDPLCVSALNTLPAEASARVFLTVLRDSLAGARDASDLLFPRVDLSALFPEPAAAFIASHAGELRFGTAVRDLRGLLADFDRVIVAVGPHQLKALLPGLALKFEYQPIYTCYLQYPATTSLPFPMLGLDSGLVQWVFDRGALTGDAGLLACVISARGDHQQMEHAQLAANCHRELARAFGPLPGPEWSRVIAEKRATIACTPGLLRPGPQTATPRLLLAGDYTDQHYPPVLEGAVRSGVRAALLAVAEHQRCAN